MSIILSEFMDSVFEDCMAPRLNDPLGGTGHKESQIEARALIGVVKTDDAGGAMAASGTEADRNSKIEGSGGSATCDVQSVCSAGAHEIKT
jgi:hypothetical protein